MYTATCVTRLCSAHAYTCFTFTNYNCIIANISLFLSLSIYIHIYIYMYIRTPVYTHIHIHIYIYIYTHMYTHINSFIYTVTHVIPFICMRSSNISTSQHFAACVGSA